MSGRASSGGRRRGRPRLPEEERQTSVVQALDRGLSLLALVSDHNQCTLTELAAIADMAPSTVHRMLETLRLHGLVAFDDSAQIWTVGVEAFRIGSAFARRSNYIEAGRAQMRRLTERTGETANIAIADQGDVVYVSQIDTHEPIRAFFPPGTRGYMHASGIGKILLAHMPRRVTLRILEEKGVPAFTDKTIVDIDALFAELAVIRERGWSIDDEERHAGMRCLAAPIFNEFGEAIAGISISGPIVRLPDDTLAELGPVVREAADEVTLAIGGTV